jgi:uncharacterized protein (TIGR02996 family)
MTDGDALLAAIRENPEEDLHRLAYADWLDEQPPTRECPTCKDRGNWEVVDADGFTVAIHACFTCGGTGRVSNGNAERAEFIRDQITTGRPTNPPSTDHLMVWVVADKVFPKRSTAQVVNAVTFRRGFVDEVRLSAAAFLGGPCERCGGRGWYDRNPGDGEMSCLDCSGTGRTPGLAGPLFAAHPITRVVLTDKVPHETRASSVDGMLRQGEVVADPDE